MPDATGKTLPESIKKSILAEFVAPAHPLRPLPGENSWKKDTDLVR